MTELYCDQIPSPIGAIHTVFDDLTLYALCFEDYRERMLERLERRFAGLKLTPRTANAFRRPLEAYFAGEYTAIDKLAVDGGGSEFQRKVWRALREIPCGQTISYGELAGRIGLPTASRAVGLANGQNPIPLVVPCHRVIGASGKLTGYGGGLDRKRWLLEHERGFAALRTAAGSARV